MDILYTTKTAGSSAIIKSENPIDIGLQPSKQNLTSKNKKYKSFSSFKITDEHKIVILNLLF